MQPHKTKPSGMHAGDGNTVIAMYLTLPNCLKMVKIVNLFFANLVIKEYIRKVIGIATVEGYRQAREGSKLTCNNKRRLVPKSMLM